MRTNYQAAAEQVIARARTILAAGQLVATEVDTTGLSEIGRHVVGKINDFAFSPEIAARSELREGYSRFTAIVAQLRAANNPDWSAASDAQDLISDAAEQMGFEI